MDLLLQALQERAKELNCLYLVEEILNRPDEPLVNICPKIVEALPPHWQYPDVCEAELTIEGETYRTPGFRTTPWIQHAEVPAQDAAIGRISVVYTKQMPEESDGPFLKEETKLITTVAERLGHFINHQRMRQLLQELDTARSEQTAGGTQEWRVALEMLKQADRTLYFNVSRKMLNHLCWNGVSEAEALLQSLSPHAADMAEGEAAEDWNQSDGQAAREITPELIERVFSIAAKHFDHAVILDLIQKWMVEDKLSFLSRVVNRNLSLAEVADALRRYHHLSPAEFKMSEPHTIGITVSLIRRFLSDQLEFITVARDYFDPRDFHALLQNVIFSGESHGKLGGKSAGVILATRILEAKSDECEVLRDVKVPKTWYITSDVVLDFMHFNNFGGVVEQKYKDINQVRMEYPHIRQSFKAGHFPAEIINGLSTALDDFGDCPLIVRSSSLLEDRLGAAFSGKYKSLFLANQGSKRERLEALMMAIAEVYASVFGPDPIEYRIERGLIDFGEEMGIMIQEVVGTRVGPYFLPTFAGVAFSNNEFRWSPRIRRDDGLIRLVPGLGTRAVDRLSDDYPILIAPGQPGLRVNVSIDEMVRYSPKKIDVINLEANRFETVDLDRFFGKWGHKIPGFENVVSVFAGGHLQTPMGLTLNGAQGSYVATFAGLAGNTRFVEQMKAILDTLKEILNTPVDIEFASDGNHFYLLQCRPQSYSAEARPAPIPRDVPRERMVFSANRYVTNGYLRNISHIVYVHPAGYAALADNADLLRVGRAVGRLNKLLPKQQFVLIGPGRWGSRGDIKLGVNVTYSDINNTAALIEVARKKDSYVPDLSFGTHFFQDLVEANIRYLPLYPDDTDVVFNERFLLGAPNILPELLPEFADLKDVIRLIDVQAAADGRVLNVLMNADLDEALGLLAEPNVLPEEVSSTETTPGREREAFWRWRLQMAERIAAAIDPKRFGVAGAYVFGSVKNATAGPGSDIDLLLHVRGTPDQQADLQRWLEGWSLCLAELNYLKTGYRTEGLLDVHYVTDKDIEQRSSYAAKIDAVTDAARPMPLAPGGQDGQGQQ
jgi:hypothetical protein